MWLTNEWWCHAATVSCFGKSSDCAPVQPEGYAGAFLIRKELPKIFCTILRNTLKARVRGQMLVDVSIFQGDGKSGVWDAVHIVEVLY